MPNINKVRKLVLIELARLYFLFSLTDPRAIRSAAFRVTTVCRVIHACLLLGTPNSSDSAACLGSRLLALSLVLDRYARRGCSTCVRISFAITTANGLEYLGTNGWLGLAFALRVRHLALTGSKFAVLLRPGTSCSGNSSTAQRT